MQNQSASLFITKVRERKDKNGQTYFIGSLGLATLMIRPHKTNKDEWNLFLMESIKKTDQPQNNGFQQQSGGGYAAPDFNSNEDIPF